MITNRGHPIELAPSVHVGNYGMLLDHDYLDGANVKVIVNCGTTGNFLQFLDMTNPVISSDVIVLNLDPHTSNTDAAYQEFHIRFNRVLQNYLAFFYNYNSNVEYFINSNYQNAKLSFNSPTMNGVPLKSLFNINRLLKLIKNFNPAVGFLFVSENFGHQHPSNSLLYALCISVLMDNYNYNFDASHRYLRMLIGQSTWSDGSGAIPVPELFNLSHYDDILLIDSLKKFFVENGKIKQAESGVMTKNFRLKRSMDSLEAVPSRRAKRMA